MSLWLFLYRFYSMFSKTQGIVLHSLKYTDNSIICHIYTYEHGRLSFIVQGIHSKKATFKPAYFQPLTIVDLDIVFVPDKNLHRIKEISVTKPLHSVHDNPYKNTIALFIGELLFRVLRENETGEQLFNFTSHGIELLDTLQQGIANFHLVFLAHLCKYLGFYPANTFNTMNCFFNARNGMFEPKETLHSLSKEDSQLLSHLLSSNFSTLECLELNQTKRITIMNHLIEYYHLHLPGMKPIQSIEILHDVFS